ncbi:MAG: glycosyltransferase family 9 protein, partial [Candidatus Hydrogenedentota bacterium]
EIILTFAKKTTINSRTINFGGKNNSIIILDIGLRLDEYLSFISRSSYFIGPSTGPTQLAAALNIKTVGIYSPVKVHSEKRWGFYENNNAVVFTPKVDCPGVYSCLFSKCKYYFCMEQIKPEDIVEYIRQDRR